MQTSAGAATTSLIGALEARTAQSGIGTQRGERGAVVSLPSGIMDLADPLATDRNLAASLPQHVASLIASDGNTAALETRWRMYGEPAREVLEAAYRAVSAAMQPATDAQLAKALATLRSVTKAAAMADDDMDLSNAVLTRELQRFPADAALSAIRHLARESTFFPSLAELTEACHRRCASRMPLHRLLTRMLT